MKDYVISRRNRQTSWKLWFGVGEKNVAILCTIPMYLSINMFFLIGLLKRSAIDVLFLQSIASLDLVVYQSNIRKAGAKSYFDY